MAFRWGRARVRVWRLERACVVKQRLCAQGRGDEDGNLDGTMSPAFACPGEGWQVGAIKGYNPGEMRQTCDLERSHWWLGAGQVRGCWEFPGGKGWRHELTLVSVAKRGTKSVILPTSPV